MKSLRLHSTLGVSLLAASAFWAAPQLVCAQTLGEMNATMDMQNTLDSGPVGSASGGGFDPIGRARNAAAISGGQPGFGGFPQGQNAGPEGGPGLQIPNPLESLNGPLAPPTVDPLTGQRIPLTVGNRITVLTGTRVFDPVSGLLLDDARKIQVPEDQQDQYFDDGTHGDLVAKDGTYTNVDETHNELSQADQRIKEQLVKALVNANDMTPLRFYGYVIMSTEARNDVSTDRAWKLVPSPDGIGETLKQVPIDQPLEVPNYREKSAEKDQRIKNDWSDRFLAEFRKKKGDLTSEFYPMFVPMPPAPPATVEPPTSWYPFRAAIPSDLMTQLQQAQTAQTPGAAGASISDTAAGFNGGPGLGQGGF